VVQRVSIQKASVGHCPGRGPLIRIGIEILVILDELVLLVAIGLLTLVVGRGHLDPEGVGSVMEREGSSFENGGISSIILLPLSEFGESTQKFRDSIV
jgi:hypothetical protein